MGGGMSGPGWMPGAPPNLAELLSWHPQPIPFFPLGCLLAAALYAAAMHRLRRRGDRWPIGRALAFAAGLATVLEMTATGIGGYGMRLLSVHMVQHMVLSSSHPYCCCSARRSPSRCAPCPPRRGRRRAP